MAQDNKLQKSNLVAALREGVSVVQMVLFKELRSYLFEKYTELDDSMKAMLTGAIINRLFGVENPEIKFRNFNVEHHGLIEQELLGLTDQFPALQGHITDALRIQTLCDNQEGVDSTIVLQQAEDVGILIEDRDLPLPSTFMTLIRQLGEQNGLTIAPCQITPHDDSSLTH